jgi:hypothetical protein
MTKIGELSPVGNTATEDAVTLSVCGCTRDIGSEVARQKSTVSLRLGLHNHLLSVIRKIEGLEIPSGKSSPSELC